MTALETGSMLETVTAERNHFQKMAERFGAAMRDHRRRVEELRRELSGQRDQVRRLSQEVEARDLCISLIAGRMPTLVKSAKREVAATWTGDFRPFSIDRAGDGRGSTPETPGHGGGEAGG